MEKTAKRRSSGLKRAKGEPGQGDLSQPLCLYTELDEGCKAYSRGENEVLPTHPRTWIPSVSTLK